MKYNATVTVDSTTCEEADTDLVLNALIGMSPAIGWNDQAHMLVTVTFDADALIAASNIAVQAAHEATGATPLAVEVVPTSDFDAQRPTLRLSA